MERVRYIHLNRSAGIVMDIGELDHYPYSGHSVVTEKVKRAC